MRIFVAGHNGMVGRAIVKELEVQKRNYRNLSFITTGKENLDLTVQNQVQDFFNSEEFDSLVICAAKVGGIYANSNFSADFLYQNLMIQSNLIHESFRKKIKKILFLGSSCIYPKYSKQPIKEEYLLDGKLEETNEAYAIAKIAGIKMCENYNKQYNCDFRSVMPTNLYGHFDNFDENTSHVIPALINRFHNAKVENKETVEVWGSGEARRDFLNVNDMASASVHIFMMEKEIYDKNVTPDCSHINIGSGTDISIAEIAFLIKEIVGFKGDLKFNANKLEGTPRKLLDTTRLKNLGWQPQINLKEGIKSTYKWYLDNL